MAWFRKKKVDRKDQIAEQHRLEEVVSIEVENHKDATKETIAKTQQVVDNFNEVIRKNGFTIKIHVAAGGKR